jgi:hypothetical protein
VAIATSDPVSRRVDSTLKIGGYAQPQFLLRQNDKVAQFDEDGFALRRSRVTVDAERPGEVAVGLFVEAELTPQPELLDSYVRATGQLPLAGGWQVRVGQLKAPVSRQSLLSDSRLQFVDKAQLASLAPDRQLGGAATVSVPGAPWIELTAGVFNGEGRNKVENIDEHFLTAGRLELKPFGRDARLAEGAFGPTQLAVAVSAARNVTDRGDYNEVTRWIGFDVTGVWKGLSANVEYLLVDHNVPADTAGIEYQAYGWNAQVGWLLPLPAPLTRKLELAGRWEAIDRNDTVPIEGPGDPNQTQLIYTAELSYYHREHGLKAQLALSHIQEYEDRDRLDEDATYDNDTLLAQITYVLE